MTTEQMKTRPGDQPLPQGGQERVQDALIADIRARRLPVPRTVPLRDRDGEVIAEAIVDAADHEWITNLGAWHRARNGYAQRTWTRQGKRHHVYLHRLVMEAGTNDPQVDHRNRNRLDCRKSNLTFASNAQNAQNTGSMPGSSSIYRGVTWDVERGKWQASGRLNGKRHFLGRFDDEDAAGAAAEAWRAENMPFSDEARRLEEFCSDVSDRRELGVRRYGSALMTHNGRDAVQDALEEAVDLAVYLKQVALEVRDYEAALDRLAAVRDEWKDHCLHTQTKDLLDALTTALGEVR